MKFKQFLSFFLCITMLMSVVTFAGIDVSASDTAKTERTVYLHAQGDNPTDTPSVSTVYMGEAADVYFAVDNPNKGDYSNGVHLEPQYDMNGYTVKIYYDSAYLKLEKETSQPIDYKIPNRAGSSDTTEVTPDASDRPQTVPEAGADFYVVSHGSGEIKGTTMKTAYITVFFSGTYLRQELEAKDEDGNPIPQWYNLCKLPLVPQKEGSTKVYIDIDTTDSHTLELFAKDVPEEGYDPTFTFSAVDGGWHTINILSPGRPTPPIADPNSGTYTEAQSVTLTAGEGCNIYYSTDGGKTYVIYNDNVDPEKKEKIEVKVTSDIVCYAEKDGKKSNVVTYEYKIVPVAPLLFNSEKDTPISYIYSEFDTYKVYASHEPTFEPVDIEHGNHIFYTFGSASTDIFDHDFDGVGGKDPYKEWVEIPIDQSITVTKKENVRLITYNVISHEVSEVSEYILGIKPSKVTDKPDAEPDPVSGRYESKINVALECKTKGAQIYYTTDGSDPITNGILYTIPLSLGSDTTIRAVSKFDGMYGERSSFYYLFDYYDDFGVEAFYPSGVYEGVVNVTLTPNNPENSVIYSTDGGVTWVPYEKVLELDRDTEVYAKAVDPSGDEGGLYVFTYKIKPLPPEFAPESTQFTNSDRITVYCVESSKENTSAYKLYYTTDGSDPITNGKLADDVSDTALIEINGYTVVSAVVLKDGTTWSTVVTHSYDIVNAKPVKPITTLTPGYYTHEIENKDGFSTQFMPVPNGTVIYYTISYDGTVSPDPLPDSDYTFVYDGTPIPVKGDTLIKAVAVNVFGVKSDIGIFSYIVTPEAPEAAPSARISGDILPVVPVNAVVGSTVHYEINGVKNSFVCTDGNFVIDTSTGNAYDSADDVGTDKILGEDISFDVEAPAVIDIWSELDGKESGKNRYSYSLSGDDTTLAPPYADKDTGEYEQKNIDGKNNFLIVRFYSLNADADIEYMLDNSGEWLPYSGNDGVAFKEDSVLQLRCVKGDRSSSVVSYVYNFVPLAPIIVLPSGRYSPNPVPKTTLTLDPQSPTDRRYNIFYRQNGSKEDLRYTNNVIDITHTMSFKAYTLDEKTGKKSKNTINYYIIENEASGTGSVYVANPYNVNRIAAHKLDDKPYTEGIKLVTPNKEANINYYYTYTREDGVVVTTRNIIYDNSMPIFVNSAMENITISAWLTDREGYRIEDSEMEPHFIEFVDLKIPVTSLYLSHPNKSVYDKNTKYTIINDYPDDKNMYIYYTTDGSDPDDFANDEAKLYDGSEMKISKDVTVKTAYYSACGKCVECKADNFKGCWDGIWSEVGTYSYEIPPKGGAAPTGGGGGGGGVVDKTRKYTVDIFGMEHPTHIGYINGYPDGSVQPDGNITREEVSAILFRVKPNQYDAPIETGLGIFPDVEKDRWSVREIEHLTAFGIINGYPDGTFIPTGKLTRAEFSALIHRFIKKAEIKTANLDVSFPDIEGHWAYEDIMFIAKAGLVNGYEDGTFRPEREITRAEVMKVMNVILGRKPLETYVKYQDFNPFYDLDTDKWYYTDVLEATITHDYYLNDKGFEYKWENLK